MMVGLTAFSLAHKSLEKLLGRQVDLEEITSVDAVSGHMPQLQWISYPNPDTSSELEIAQRTGLRSSSQMWMLTEMSSEGAWTFHSDDLAELFASYRKVTGEGVFSYDTDVIFWSETKRLLWLFRNGGDFSCVIVG